MLMLSRNRLPQDILFRIFYYLDVSDICRMRSVSRYLNEVSHRKHVWIEAYRNADFVRPPGPFLFQSAQDLENALVPSFRAHRNFQKQDEHSVQEELPVRRKFREIPCRGHFCGAGLVFARFLFVAFKHEVRCYDLNSNLGPSVIYKPTDGRALKQLRTVSAIDVEGHPFACVVLAEAVRGRNRISIYLLNVDEQSKVTLDSLHQFEHEMFHELNVTLGPRVILFSGTLDLEADEDWCVVALDVHSRTQFLPSALIYPEDGDGDEMEELLPPSSISTSTHILCIVGDEWNTVFQAYTLPPANANKRSTPLSHSHYGVHADEQISDVVLLHDAVLDPSTQDTLIMIAFLDSAGDSQYGTLHLGRSDEEVGTITLQSLGSFTFYTSASFDGAGRFRTSFNGTGRVFYDPEPGFYGMMEYDMCGKRGSDDDESRAIVRDYPSVIESPSRGYLVDCDPYSGRVCMMENGAIEVLDFAV